MLAPIDWKELLYLTTDEFDDYVKSLPSERYKETDPEDGETLLHFAARHCSVKSAVHLIRGGVNIHALTSRGISPLLIVIHRRNADMVKVLIAAGSHCSDSFSYCHGNSSNMFSITCIFIANGYRIRPHLITFNLRKFQNGVLRCRSATIAMIRLKHYYKNVDRFLFREMAFSIWVTRSDDEWST